MNRYRIIEKHPAYEVWEKGVMIARYPNRADAKAAIKRFKDADKRHEI